MDERAEEQAPRQNVASAKIRARIDGGVAQYRASLLSFHEGIFWGGNAPQVLALSLVNLLRNSIETHFLGVKTYGKDKIRNDLLTCPLKEKTSPFAPNALY